MSKKKFDIEDMALEGEEKTRKLDMELESPSPVETAARIKEIYPDQNIIKVDEKVDIMKMASGDYKFGNTLLKDCTPDDLNKIDEFLKKKE